MKKTIVLSIVLLMTLIALPSYSVSAETNLINNMQMSLKNTENPKRLEVSFILSEPINLSQGNSNIIFEYLMKDDNGDLAVKYLKDKSWSGFLNSYDNYPSGERKYSSGAENNTAYSNTIPATTIYTSTKTNASIDVTLVDAVRLTVFRADGSGERVTLYNNGTISTIDKIEVPVSNTDISTGIKLQSTSALLPVDTVVVADEITSGAVFDTIFTVLTDAKNFIAFDIKLEANGLKIQPNGKVIVSIPIPEGFNSSRVAIYKIDGVSTTNYPKEVTTNEGVEYVTFETEHFSIYALVELVETAEKTESPQTESPQTERPQAESPQAESPQTESPQAESLQAESPQKERPQAESPQAESPQVESLQSESLKMESLKAESLKTEELQTEGLQTEETSMIYLYLVIVIVSAIGLTVLIMTVKKRSKRK